MGFQLRSTSSNVFDVAMASAIGLTASPTSLHAITASCTPCVTTTRWWQALRNELCLFCFMASGTQADTPGAICPRQCRAAGISFVRTRLPVFRCLQRRFELQPYPASLNHIVGNRQPDTVIMTLTFVRLGMASRKKESLTVSAGSSGALHNRTYARQK